MLIIGHRGARNEAPENTLVGFRHLRSLGIHHVELDVRLSADNELIVLHDTTLDRTTECTGLANTYSAEQLAHINATTRFVPTSEVPILHLSSDDSFGVPTLSRVLEEWPELRSIQLEVKTTDITSLRSIATQLGRLIHARRLQQQATVTSMDVRLLRDMQHRFPWVQRGYVAERFVRSPVATARRLGCRLLVINWRRVKPRLIAEAHSAGLHVSVWTVNDLPTAERLMEWGVDSLITDVPQRMRHLSHATDLDI